jgi:hypothetical protein
MPSNKRKVLKRTAAQSYQHIMRAMQLILELKEEFGESHTDYQDAFTVTMDGLALILGTLEQIYTHAWGTFPDDLDAWLK